MEELSLHILDIVENSINAGADSIIIKIVVDQQLDLFKIEIIDNGIGMDAATLKQVMDPFFTTKPERKTGLGLPLLAQAAELSGGKVTVNSQSGIGTTVTATFQYSHIDRQPLGNIDETLLALIISHPEIHFIYQYENNMKKIYLDTNEVKTQIAPYPINSSEGIQELRKIVAFQT
jgi:DNA mismatch repair ATPase MutL